MSNARAAAVYGADPKNGGPHATSTENSTMAKRASTTHSKDINECVAKAAAGALHGILPKDAAPEVRRIAKVAFSMGFASGFDAGFESATRADATFAGKAPPVK